MTWLRRKTPVPVRKPHPDARVEADLQVVLSLHRAAARTERRLNDIGDAQEYLDHNETFTALLNQSTVQMAKQAERLRFERADLEKTLAAQLADIAKRIADLGDLALWL